MKSWYANTSVSPPWTKPKLKNCSIHSIHPNISKQNPGYKVSKTAVNQNSPPLPDSYEPLIDKDTIGLIVQLVNEVGLFIEQLDVNDVITRYEKAMLNPVTSKNNTRLVLLLDKLAMHDIIPYDWQSVIAKKQLVRSSSGKKFLNQHDLSSTLNRIKDIQPSISEKKFFATIDRYIKLIKDKEID